MAAAFASTPITSVSGRALAMASPRRPSPVPRSRGSVLAKHFGVEVARDLVPWHPTLGDVDSPQALADYQAAKRVHKAQWSAAPSRVP